MCTAYEIDGSNYEVDFLVADALEATMADAGAYQLIRHNHVAPVVTAERRVRLMACGFRIQVPAKKTKFRWQTVMNSREDMLGKSPNWGPAFRERRCVVPVRAYYDWMDGEHGKKVNIRVKRVDGRLMWVAGMWRHEEERGDCFSLITTEPTEAISAVHDRMLAVLPEEKLQPYLNMEFDTLGPSQVPLEWTISGNYLTDGRAQGELF